MEESDSSPTVFIREKADAIFDHLAKKAAIYISSAIITATGAIISSCNSHVAEKTATHEIKSDASYLGESWVGTNMLQMNSLIWESRQMISDLRSNIAVLQQRLDTGETNKVKP